MRCWLPTCSTDLPSQSLTFSSETSGQGNTSGKWNSTKHIIYLMVSSKCTTRDRGQMRLGPYQSQNSSDLCLIFIYNIGLEFKMAMEKIAELQKCYIDISTRASEEMATSVSIKNLRYSVLCLPSHLKKEHKKFVREAKADLKEADSVDDVFIVVGEHNDYLRYSLLKHLIDLYGSEQLKKEMGDYATRVQTFRMETRLEVFSEVCDDQPEKVNGRFAEMVTKHEMSWARATLEYVEKFRIKVCRELSLYEFSLNLLRAEQGCVEITWRVPRCLVAYIQKSVKPSSQAMRQHHVTSLTIDGFVAYTSATGRLTFT